MKLLDMLERIERVDQLIRLKATGRPKELACRLNISERAVYNLIDTMKIMGAPIYYSSERRSYCYSKKARFIYGFEPGEEERIFGGGYVNNWVKNYCSKQPYFYPTKYLVRGKPKTLLNVELQ